MSDDQRLFGRYASRDEAVRIQDRLAGVGIDVRLESSREAGSNPARHALWIRHEDHHLALRALFDCKAEAARDAPAARGAGRTRLRWAILILLAVLFLAYAAVALGIAPR